MEVVRGAEEPSVRPHTSAQNRGEGLRDESKMSEQSLRNLFSVFLLTELSCLNMKAMSYVLREIERLR